MKNKKGFTLVEIMIVVVIIGLLAAMAVPAFQKVREATDEKAALNDLRQLASGADQYFLEYATTTVDQETLLELYVKSLNDRYTYPGTITTADAVLSADLPNGDTATYRMHD